MVGSRVTVFVSGPVMVLAGGDGEVVNTAVVVGNLVSAPAGAGVWASATGVDVVVFPVAAVPVNSDKVRGPGICFCWYFSGGGVGDSGSGVVGMVPRLKRGKLCKKVKSSVSREAMPAIPLI